MPQEIKSVKNIIETSEVLEGSSLSKQMTTNYTPETRNPWGRSKSECAEIRLFEAILMERVFMSCINNRWTDVVALKYENIPIWPLGSCLLGNNNTNKVSVK